MQIHKEIPPKLDSKAVCSIDIEVFGMKKWQLHRPIAGHFASMQVCFNGEDVYVTEQESDVPKFLTQIKSATHVFHNAPFDIRHIRRWAKYPDKETMHDTMIFDRIMWGGYFDSFGLKDLCRRYLDLYLDKKEREEFATATEMTPEMLKYACDDALVTWQIYQKQLEQCRTNDLKIWNDIDKPAMYAIMDFKGMPMDREKWMALAKHNKEIAEGIQKKLPFNLNSWKQVLSALHASGLTKIEGTEERLLAPYAEHPMVADIMTYRKINKRSSTYGTEFAEKYIEADDRVYPDFDVTKAESGRMSSSDPNAQNIPSDKEYRGCFIAEPEHDILVLDYSAQEPRITAWESQDPNLLKAIQAGDIHLAVSRDIYGDPTMKKSDPRRKYGKALNLGLTYGLTAGGLRRKLHEEEGIDMTYEEAEELVSKYFRRFSGVKHWIDGKRSFGQKNGYVETHSGRRIWLNRYSYQWMNNAINAPIQGGAADITKLAVTRFRKDCQDKGIDFPMIAVIHDEFVCHVPKTQLEDYTAMAQKAMIGVAEEVYSGIPFEVEIKHGKSWACKTE